MEMFWPEKVLKLVFIFYCDILCFISINIWFKSNSRFKKTQWTNLILFFLRKKFKHKLMQTLIVFISVSQKWEFLRN